MEIQTLKVATRNETGKGPAGRRRMAGEIPGVVYGESTENFSVAINAKAFEVLVHSAQGEHAVVQLDVEDKPELSGPIMIKALQHHPIKDHVMHADFLRIQLDKAIQTHVPIKLVGHCVGIVEGGVPDQHVRELRIECLPLEVPENFEIDITDIAIGGRLHVSDLTTPDGMTILTEADRTIISIHAPRVVEETTTEEGEEGVAVDAADGEGGGEGEETAEA
ncbi:MAG: 50S ribosomal protein L25 [Candidatus Hydrogenedentes bacterium]|nr:50S ribosomal protein L25 [Candidatus Hydrogenedentota bacterium]